MFQTKVVKKIKTNFVYNFFFLNRAVCEIMWKNIVELDSSYMTIRHMRIIYWIPKATNTHSEYITLIAVRPQQVLRERASVLRYMYAACLVKCIWSSHRQSEVVI